MTGHIRKRNTQKGASWQIVLNKGADVNGKRIRKYITVNGTKQQAKAELATIISEYNNGSYIEASQMTLQALIAQWLTVYAEPRLAPSTISGYKVNFEKHTIPYIGNIAVQKLTGSEIEVLQYAYRTCLIPVNPADYVSPPRQSRHKAEVYTAGEVAELLHYATGTDMEIPLMLDLETGLRRGELLALKWSDIDWEARTLTVCRNLFCLKGEYLFGTPKTAAGNRQLLLSEALLTRLKQYRARQAVIRLQLGVAYQNHDLICCKDDGSPYNTGSFSHKFSNLLKKNGLKPIRLHDIRYTNATLMLENGVPAKIASERLGHSGIAITLDTYSHVSLDMQKDAVEKLSNGIFDESRQQAK